VRLAAALCILTSGCATGGGNGPALPFRVAIAPIRVEQHADEGPAAFEVAVEPERLAARLAEELASGAFADACVIAGGAAEDELVRLAVGARANLLLDCEVRVVPTVTTETNDRLWLNLVLFLIGGPLSWLVPDRTYRFDVQMVAHLHVVDPMQDGLASLSDQRARIGYTHAQMRQIDLNLIDRAGNPLPYLASIVVPAAFLVTTSGTTRATVEECIVDALARDINAQVAALGHLIAEGGLVVRIGLEGYEVAHEADTVRFRASAVLRPGTATRLAHYTVRLGEQEIAGTFDEPAERGAARGALVYPIDVSFRAPVTGTHLELELVTGGRDRLRRTFCVPLRR